MFSTVSRLLTSPFSATTDANPYVSDFLSKFDEHELLGEGGFGKVFKARMKPPDGQLYAIKRIAVDISDIKRKEEISREVTALAHLNHPRIVRYFTSWWETPPVGWQEAEDAKIRRTLPNQISDNSVFEGSSEDDSFDIIPEGMPSLTSAINEMSNRQALAIGDSPREEMHLQSGETSTLIQHTYLFIQQELCERDTLANWLDKERTPESHSQPQLIAMFKELVEGLNYVHKKNIIHRDLKPSNIFFASDPENESVKKLKIGDFGLATSFTVVSPSADDELIAVSEQHSANKGTSCYMAPEQICAADYTEYTYKVDIYSLGIIAVELFYPMETVAEKVAVFRGIRSSRFPEVFKQTWPQACDYVQWLTDRDPEKRPTCQDILDSFSSPQKALRASRPCDFLIQNSEPVPDASKIAIYRPKREVVMRTHGLRTYSIGKERVEDMEEKVILVVGGTGSGKTTLVNSLVNYLYGVDATDSYRFKLISSKDEAAESGGTLVAGKGRTKHVSVYKLNGTRKNYSVVIVDTPGFGDPDGLDEDKRTVDYISEWFKRGGGINAVCLVVKANENRLTVHQQWELNSVIALFAKNMKNNIISMFTHTPFNTFFDESEPQALEVLRANNIVCDQHYLFENGAVFDAIQSSTDDSHADIKQKYWEKVMMSYEKFIDGLDSLQAQSLDQSRLVLENRKQLEHQAMKLSEQMDVSIRRVTEIKSGIAQIQRIQQLIDDNKDYVFRETITKAVQVSIKGTGIHCTHCLTCNYTCHADCAIAEDGKKEWCLIMDDVIPPKPEQLKASTKNDIFLDRQIGETYTVSYIPTPEQNAAQKERAKCTVCPERCHWKQHADNDYITEFIPQEVVYNKEDMLKRFNLAKEDKQKSHKMLEQMARAFVQQEKEVAHIIRTIREVLNKLTTFALLPHFTTDAQYLQLMIESEKQARKTGFEKRVTVLQRHLKTAKLVEQAKSTDAMDLMESTENASIRYLQKAFPYVFNNDDARSSYETGTGSLQVKDNKGIFRKLLSKIKEI